MTRRRRYKNYKQVKTMTKNMGSGGAQVLLGSVSALDPSLSFGWFNNVICTLIQNTGEQETGGFIFYLSTNNSWAEEDVITARAGPLGGGSVNLTAKRKVSAELFDDLPLGKIYLWAELTDITLAVDVEVRAVLEFWGRFITFVAD